MESGNRNGKLAWWRNPGTYFAVSGAALALLVLTGAPLDGDDWRVTGIYAMWALIGALVFIWADRMSPNRRRSGGLLMVFGAGIAGIMLCMTGMGLLLGGSLAPAPLVIAGLGVALALIGFGWRVLAALESPRSAA